MADIKCRNCGEPWDLDTLHEEVKERDEDGYVWEDGETYESKFRQVRQEFRKKGCGTFSWASPCAPTLDEASRSVLDAISDVMGDDVDGEISMIEDAESMGLL